jgi:hypothetical protein
LNEFIEKLIKLLKDEERDYRMCWKYKGENEEDWQCMKAMQKAIGIVEQLAEEHSNDFCEWSKTNVGGMKLIREPHRMYLFKERDDEWEYCPYCGKKIKVVDAPYKKGE